jgi:hypothetical protein
MIHSKKQVVARKPAARGKDLRADGDKEIERSLRGRASRWKNGSERCRTR